MFYCYSCFGEGEIISGKLFEKKLKILSFKLLNAERHAKWPLRRNQHSFFYDFYRAIKYFQDVKHNARQFPLVSAAVVFF